jgi:hypothetical protein
MLKPRCELSTNKGRLKLMLKAADWHDNELKVKVWRKPQRSATNHRLPRRCQRADLAPASASTFPLRSCPNPAHSFCPAAAPAGAAPAACPPSQSRRTVLNSAFSMHLTVCVRRAQCRASAAPNGVHPPRPLSTTPNNARSRHPMARVCGAQRHTSVAQRTPVASNGARSSRPTALVRRAQRRSSAVPNGACPPRPMARIRRTQRLASAAPHGARPSCPTAHVRHAQRRAFATLNSPRLSRSIALVRRAHPSCQRCPLTVLTAYVLAAMAALSCSHSLYSIVVSSLFPPYLLPPFLLLPCHTLVAVSSPVAPPVLPFLPS